VDRASGYVITDRMPGRSDHRYYGWPGDPQRMLETRTKLVVRVSPEAGGARVAVDAYEETNYPESAAHAPGPGFGFPRRSFGPRWEVRDDASWHGPRLVRVDRWIPTASSTLREKALLDRIEALLRRR
jgi:hypothetical protein